MKPSEAAETLGRTLLLHDFTECRQLHQVFVKLWCQRARIDLRELRHRVYNFRELRFSGGSI